MRKNGITFWVSLAILLGAGCDKSPTPAKSGTTDVAALESELESVKEQIHQIEKALAQIPPGTSIDSMIDKTKSDMDETSARIEALRLGIKQVNEQISDESQ